MDGPHYHDRKRLSVGWFISHMTLTIDHAWPLSDPIPITKKDEILGRLNIFERYLCDGCYYGGHVRYITTTTRILYHMSPP